LPRFIDARIAEENDDDVDIPMLNKSEETDMKGEEIKSY
jgi:hypothetical protein